MTVQHRPRVVWDGARVFVRATQAPGFFEFAWAVRESLGREMYDELIATHERLAVAAPGPGADRYAADLEAGRWRVRLDELLAARPELTPAVVEMTNRG